MRPVSRATPPVTATADAFGAPADRALAFYQGSTLKRDDSIGWLVKQIFQGMTRELHERMAALGVTPAQWPLLLVMKQCSDPSAIELARLLQMNAGAMTRMIDRLVEKGLIERSRCPVDRRATRLALTDAGHEALEPISAVLAGTLNDLLRGFSRADFNALLSLLRRVHANTQALPANRAGMADADDAAAAAPGDAANPAPADAGQPGKPSPRRTSD